MYTLAIQFYSHDPEPPAATETIPPKEAFTPYRSLHKAMAAVQAIDMREFVPELARELPLSRQMKTAAVLDGSRNVVFTVRYFDQYENIGMPPGIYLNIQPSTFSLDSFEKLARFPLSSYKALGPQEAHFLLHTKADLLNQQQSIINKHYRNTTRSVKADRNSSLKP
ncbi:hypothetical protein [uncultured Chitinophaga sp.]|uniref:hypothetical protein n=1 Tax=uncultured Chitinophaga sp. TaxID=339340 RepID=UPI00261DC688|nr:hypothetical protein [uncultured Chitinophaga sp.]